ncbi:hypothetical protein I3843_11G121600 [Carya illinoinensis]|nr:hypothetical protein I3843_11G121600 [Carya illinoinensis]KAG7956386.1 hypothetical protein I3843_11G121600 [Carya illinoinensis]
MNEVSVLSMDEVVGGATQLGAVEGAHLQSKETEYSLKSERYNILESGEMFIPGEGDYSQIPPPEFAVQEGKNVNRSINDGNGLEHPHATPCSIDDTGVMVEELRVTNYKGSNLAIVGTSNNRERMQARQNQWQHLYQLAGGSGGGNSHAATIHRDNSPLMPSFWEDIECASFPELLAQKASGDDRNDKLEQFPNAENERAWGNNHGGIRTKILSKSGFSEFFVKQTLKGKGIIHKGPPRHGFHVEPRDQNNLKIAGSTMVASDVSQSLALKTEMPSPEGVARLGPGGSDQDGVSLRQWLKVGRHKASKIKCLNIFRQIVDGVGHSHSQGVALKDLRASSFRLLPSNQVKYIGSPVLREMLDNDVDPNTLHSNNGLMRKRPLEQVMFPSATLHAKKQKLKENVNFTRRWNHFPSRQGYKFETAHDSSIRITCPQDSCNEYNEDNPGRECETQSKFSSHCKPTIAQQHLTSLSDQLEEKWYRSPEELVEDDCTTSSNIYSLGVLFFELLGRFDTERAHAAAMSDLRHRILPPNFLSENPKEAGFCLWLIHPEPSLRPTTREILQSEVINGVEEVCAADLSSSIEQDDTESELLLHFLVSLKERKREHSSKLAEDISCLEVDIEEVDRRCSLKNSFVNSYFHDDSLYMRENRLYHKERPSLDVLSQSPPISTTNELSFSRNVEQLESAYFSMRSKIQLPERDAAIRPDKDLLRNCENWHLAQKDEDKQIPTDRIGAFFDGLCKYARYSKFEVRGILRNGDFNNSANVICSLSFDRDEDYFAAAGISKKIKIFEFNALYNDSVDFHYPVTEMSNKSKLSCVCWNNYVKNYLASTDYDGVVKLWDASTGQVVSQFAEHEKRAWSVDFSRVCPTKLASGSDDCSVKLWNINERNCLDTIKNIANVCCVQFSSHSSHLLAFGSADYRTYCFDLRFAKIPWCVLAGHEKAVSYVKFLDSETLVSASTDNTLKLWNLNKTSPSGLSTNACSVTLSGHTNEKNFVGLSTANGYIACGSETNEVYAYHGSLPMPITSHKFGSIDPISGKETDEDNGQFVSSVCWRGKSDVVVAANSSGCIKVLQMV